MFTKNLVTLLMVVAVATIACPAMAEFVAQMPAGLHRGSDNPTTEGWSLYSSGTVGGGQETVGNRVWDYWQVNDATAETAPFYHVMVPSAVLADATGWTLTGVLRVNGPANNVNWPVSVSVDDGASKLWNLQMYNGTESSGEGVYRANSYQAPTQLYAMNVESDYHIYQLLYDKTADTAAVYVDGLSVGTITRAQADAGLFSGEMNFGSITSPGTGSANYAYLDIAAGHHVYSDLNQFSNQVPEPSAIVLLTAGLIGLLAYAWRRRK